MSEPLDSDPKVQAAQAQLHQIQQQLAAAIASDPVLATAIAELSVRLEAIQTTIAELQQQNTQLRSAQETLAAERLHYQDMVDFAPDAYLVTDAKGIIQAINGTAESLLNIRRDYAKNKPLVLFIAESEQFSIYTLLEQIALPRSSQHASTVPPPTPSDSVRHVTPLFQSREVWVQWRGRECVPVALSLSGEYDQQGAIVRLYWIFRELREQKQTEAALRESEAKYYTLFNAIDEGFILCDVIVDAHDRPVDLEYVEVNAAATSLVGQPLAGQRPRAISPDFELEWLELCGRVARTGKAIHTEVHAASDNAWYEFYIFRPDNANHQRVAAIYKDVSDRKHVEAQLQSSQTKFEALVTNMPGMVYRYFPATPDRPHHFTFVSHHAHALLELAPETITQDANAFVNLIHPDDVSSFVESVAHAVEHFLPWHWQGRIITPSGRLKWIQGNSQAQHAPEGAAWDGLLVDVSDRVLAEQKIREQAALLEISSDAIVVRDLNNRILYWNRGAERLYGWQSSEAVGQIADVLLQDPTSTIDVVMQRLLKTGEWRGEVHNTTKSGQFVIVEARWTLVCDAAGQPRRILAVDTDITEKKRLETQFYRTQRLESLGTLANGIAHDLNNVFTPIVAVAQLLRSHQPKTEMQLEMFRILENSAKRGASMVKQILAFTRGTEGKQVPVAVPTLLEEVVNVVRQTFPKSIQVHDNIAKQPLLIVSVDPTHLHQVLMNLCVNARDAMPNGGTLTLTVGKTVVDECFAQMKQDAKVGDYVVITVTDTGMGITPDVFDRMFEPFFTTKAQGQGTGLGLSTVLGIVKSYDGFVAVESQPGAGSQFKVYLPMLDAAPPSIESAVEPPLGQGELILVIDDEAMILQTTQATLEAYNYRVMTANNGAAAIAYYTQQHQQIATVVIDMMMPEMDGLTVIQALQAINPRVKVIAASGLAGNYRQRLQAIGVTTLLAKPFTTMELLQSISAQQRADS